MPESFLYNKEMFQRTLNKAIEFSGVGVHTGELVEVKILPADASVGISFERGDLKGSPIIKALAENVVATDFATTIGIGDCRVSTIEHLMAAFYCLGVDNAHVIVHGPEMPILDGSSAPLLEMIEEAGLKNQNASKEYLLVKKPVRVKDGDRFVYLLPFRNRREGQTLTIECTMDFTHPSLDRQSYSIDVTADSFKEEIMRARTYGFLKDVEMLRRNGLAKGGSLDNAIVLGEGYIMNEEGLRFPDEFVRHKVLDLIGDISMAGRPIIGRIKAFLSGHGLNHMLVKEILKSTDSVEVVEMAGKDIERVGGSSKSDKGKQKARL